MGDDGYSGGDEIAIDPSTVRGFAEKVHAERKYNYEPQNAVIQQLLQGTDTGADEMEQSWSPSGRGYLFDPAKCGIMTAHDGYVEQARKLLNNIGQGMQALANAAGCAAEDYTTADELNAADQADVAAYLTAFTPKWADGSTGTWAHDGTAPGDAAPPPQ